MTKTITTIGLLALACLGQAFAGDAGADSPAVYFIAPLDGDRVTSPVTVKFGLADFGVAPAGVQKVGTGHHHLLIDAPLPPLQQPVPNDAHHRHFGGGQTETVIDLEPGGHTLQLLLGDFAHIPHQPPLVSPVIHLTVVP